MKERRRVKVIACKVMLRQLYRIAAESPHTVDILWMEQRLHERPSDMRVWLQESIDRVERDERPYDAIVLAYGLCSNGTVGLQTKGTPLVIARGHDCITLLLGSRKTYADLFEKNDGGVYWYTQGWLESGEMPGPGRVERLRAEYAAQYGQDNADYLIEMEQSWVKNYHKAIYIDWPGEDDEGPAQTRQAADFFRWQYQRVQGDTTLLTDLINGPWDEERFLVLPPGATIQASNDNSIIKAE